MVVGRVVRSDNATTSAEREPPKAVAVFDNGVLGRLSFLARYVGGVADFGILVAEIAIFGKVMMVGVVKRPVFPQHVVKKDKSYSVAIVCCCF